MTHSNAVFAVGAVQFLAWLLILYKSVEISSRSKEFTLSQTDPDEPDHETVMGLLMPFVNVKSKGGKYDDEAYVAGYEIGKLVGALEWRPKKVEQLVHSSNLEQIDLVAMWHHYTIEETVAHDNMWATVTLKKVENPLDGAI